MPALAARLIRSPYILFLLLVGLFVVWRSGSSDASPAAAWRGLTGSKARGDLLLSYEPKDDYHSNLRPDLRYTTTFLIAGWNNQVIQQYHLVHFALLASRAVYPVDLIPILPDFLPDSFHLGRHLYANLLPLSEVFDLPRWSKDIGVGIVEWGNLKHGKGCCGNISAATTEELKSVQRVTEREEITGWSTHMPGFGRDYGMPGPAGWHYNLEFIWTPLPSPLFYSPAPERLHFDNLVSFLTPIERGRNKMREEYLREDSKIAKEMKKLGTMGDWGPGVEDWRRPEGEELGEVLLVDSMYYMSDRGEDVHFDNPADAWALTGRYMRWHPNMEAIGWQFVRKALGLKEGKTSRGVPPFIAVHIRRTDFMPSCPPDGRLCLPIIHYAKHVEEVKAQLKEVVKGKEMPVLVTTDESDPEYLEEIKQMGWILLDHDKYKTIETLGPWYPTLIDNVVLSLAKGLVGTDGSTMSRLAAKRVRDWNGGAVAWTNKFEGAPL